MSEYTLIELKAQRDAIDKRIANHEPLALSAAINKVLAYATERGMTEDDLFPAPIDPDADPGCDPWPDFECPPFPTFCFNDTFGYTFIADLKEQRDQLEAKISGALREI